MTSPQATPVSPVTVLRASHQRLRGVAEALTRQQLRERGYPAEWSIAQVLSHLGSGAEIMTLIVEAGLAGEEPPPREAYPPIWDRWNGKEPEDQAADGLKTDARLVELIEANAGSAARFRIWSGPTDILGLARVRLYEHVLHTWDVVVAVDPGATLLPEALPWLLDWLPRIVGHVAKPSAWTGLVRVTTSDPDGVSALTLGETSTLGPWLDAAADARLQLPAEAWIRLVYGRLDPGHTPAAVTASGIDLADLRAVFQGL